jgi:endonuclease V-like protein UPF0215 family
MPLKQLHIEQVKAYFRVAGITACRDTDGVLVVGAVYRGNNDLDGVICKRGDLPLSSLISDMLKESRHLGQIRVALLDEDLVEPSEAEELWMETGKPILMPVKEAYFDPRHMFMYRDRVILAAGIDEESARRVQDVVMGEKGSEALRIAGIILKAVLNLHNV